MTRTTHSNVFSGQWIPCWVVSIVLQLMILACICQINSKHLLCTFCDYLSPDDDKNNNNDDDTMAMNSAQPRHTYTKKLHQKVLIFVCCAQYFLCPVNYHKWSKINGINNKFIYRNRVCVAMCLSFSLNINRLRLNSCQHSDWWIYIYNIFEISNPMPEEKSLRIFVASVSHQYTTLHNLWRQQ